MKVNGIKVALAEHLCVKALEAGYLRTKTISDPYGTILHNLQVNVFGVWVTICFLEEVKPNSTVA